MCQHQRLSPTASGWICFDCFSRFPKNTYPNWENSRIDTLNILLSDYLKCREKRPKQKDLAEMIAGIEGELKSLCSPPQKMNLDS